MPSIYCNHRINSVVNFTIFYQRDNYILTYLYVTFYPSFYISYNGSFCNWLLLATPYISLWDIPEKNKQEGWGHETSRGIYWKNRIWRFWGSIKKKWNFQGWSRKSHVEFEWVLVFDTGNSKLEVGGSRVMSQIFGANTVSEPNYHK